MSNPKSNNQKLNSQPPKDLCRLLFETAGEAILVLQDGRIVDCNARAGLMLGVTSAELQGQRLSGLLPPVSSEGQSLEEVLQEAIRIALAGAPSHFIWALPQPDQVTTWLEMVLSITELEGRTFTQIIIHDISEYKQADKRAEAMLAQERNLLQTLVDHLPAHIYVKDTQGNFVFGNTATLQSLGVNTLAELVGKSDFDFSPAELAAKFYADEQALFQAGHSPVYKEDVILDHVTGERRWVAATQVLLRDQAGQVTGLVGINYDITERRQAEEQLQQSQAQLQRQSHLMEQVQAAARVGGWEINLINNTLYWTAETYRIHEVSPDEYVPSVETAIGYYAPESIPVITSAVNRAIELGEAWDHELEVITAKGRRVWVRAIGQAGFNDQGQPVRVYGSFQDITERRQLEQQIRISLERQARQFRLLTLVSQQTAAVTDLSALFERVVEWTTEQLGFYHTQLFRYEPGSTMVNLVAAYGEIGAQMLAAGYQAPLGQSLVGAAAASGISILEPDVTKAPNWRPNPYLPQTQGELVIPIKSGREDAQAQTAALQHFIDRGFDGLIISVINRDLVAPIAENAARQNIPVVFFTSALESGEQTSFVSTSEHEIGYTLGLQAGSWANEHIPAGQSLKVAILSYRTLPQLVEREEGMIAGLKQAFEGSLELIASETAGSSDQGLLVAERWLKSYPELQMILAINDVVGLGAYQAVTAAGKDDPKQFFVGGIDAIEEALTALKKGGAYQATVDLQPREAGIQAVRSLVNVIKGQSAQKVTEIKPYPVNKSNLELFLRQNEQRLNAEPAPLAGLDLSGVKIGLSIISFSNPFFVTLVEGARAEAERLGIELVINEAKQILGVLAVQSDRPGILDTEDQLALEGVAGQIASAIENTRLLVQQRQVEAELQSRLDELNALQRLMSREGWQAFQATRPETQRGYLFDQSQGLPVPMAKVEARQANGGHKAESGNGHTLLKPVTLRGETIGQLGVYTGQPGQPPLSPEDEEFLDAVAEQVAEALERARLLEQAQKRVVELETVAQVGAIASTTLEPEQLLQTVVDLTGRSFNLYHVQIYLLDDRGQNLVLAAGTGEAGSKLVARSWHIPLDHEHSLVAQAARSQQGVTVNDVQSHPDFLPNPLLPETRSEMAVPLSVGNKLLGVLDIQSDILNSFTREDIQIQATLAAQVAVALENARLFAQTQTALAETETLYDLTGLLSSATTLEEALQISLSPIHSPTLKNAALLAIEPDTNDQPEWAKVVAAWDREGQPPIPAGARFYLPDFPFSSLWFEKPDEPVLVGNVFTDDRIDPATQAIYRQIGVQGSANLQLRLNERWVGLITLNWTTPQLFSDKDQRLYQSIAAQVAVVMNNMLLLEESQRRAIQLERLSRIETMLSQAKAEADILVAVAQLVENDQKVRIALQYLETDESDWPTLSYTVASWRNGAIWGEDPIQGLVVELDQLPTTPLWANQPSQALFVRDISEDPRVDTVSRNFGAQLGIRGFVVIPLHSAGQWQGNITFSWPEPYNLTPDDQFMIQQLVEPVSAVVATRRAYLAAEKARHITENLYKATRRINEAVDMQEIVAAVAEDGPLNIFNRALLFLFEYNTSGEVEATVTAANWYSGQGKLPTEVGTRYPNRALDFIDRLPLFFDDIQLDSRVGPAMQELAQRLEFKAAAALPLWTSTRQLGTLFLEAERAHHFEEQEMQPYVALVRQVTVALENRRLLEETRLALAEVEATQRRYTVQAWEVYQARNPLKAYEKTREDMSPLAGTLPASVSEAIQSKQTTVLTPLPVQPQPESSIINDNNAEASLIVPLTVRDEIIGVLGLQETQTVKSWLPEEIELVQAIAEEIALAAENLRLLDDTQQRAAREQRVNEIGEKIRAAQTLEEALQIAVKEVGLSLKAPQTAVKLEIRNE